jgi:hypothetical protein
METYKEIQRFRQLFVWLPLGITLLIVTIVTLTASNSGDFWVERYLGLLIMIPVAALLWFIKLETKIDEKAIAIRFIPLINKWKVIKWSEISDANIRKYSPLAEYGGWGVKGFSGKNRAYNISGNIGLQLTLKNGYKILIGTNNQEKLRMYLQYIVKKYTIPAIKLD